MDTSSPPRPRRCAAFWWTPPAASRREKHGGDRTRIDLDVAAPAAPDLRHDLVALDAALTKLAVEDSQTARLVETSTFRRAIRDSGTQVLEISPRTADRVWAFARAWLHRELTGTDADPAA